MVASVCAELGASDFAPATFELDFGLGKEKALTREGSRCSALARSSPPGRCMYSLPPWGAPWPERDNQPPELYPLAGADPGGPGGRAVGGETGGTTSSPGIGG